MGVAVLVFLASLVYLCTGGEFWIATAINVVGFAVTICVYMDNVREHYKR